MFWSIYPVIYMGAVAAFAIAYIAFLFAKSRKTGEWRHRQYGFRFYLATMLFTVLFWGALGLFTGVTQEHVFRARYEPFVVSDHPQYPACRFHYVDHPNCSETVFLPELHQYLTTNKPAEVRLTLVTTWDFGDLRAYHLEKVDDIRVNEGWSNGQPPWDVLRGAR